MTNVIDRLIIAKLIELFGPDPRIAIVCRGGPENGPYSAMAARVIAEVLAMYGFPISAIYACSGSVSTALLGCIGEFNKLIDIWANLTPEKIVGSGVKSRGLYRMASLKESFYPSDFLMRELKKNSDPDKICSDKAILAEFPAVDVLASEYIIWSNKNPDQKKWLFECALGSMALSPFLPPIVIRDPEESGLIEKGKSRTIQGSSRLMPLEKKPYKAALLIDGGYMGNMLLEKAQRDGFNIIFLIDIHGLEPTETDLHMKPIWPNFVRLGQHILSNVNDKRQYLASTRVNAEIDIKEMIQILAKELPPEFAEKAEAIVAQMDDGRLRLGDKTRTQIYPVSNREHSILFNFTHFEQQDVQNLMTWGREAALNTLQGDPLHKDPFQRGLGLDLLDTSAF